MAELSYEYREQFACDVCGNVPDETGMIEHGRGCYVVSADGGGETWVYFPEWNTANERTVKWDKEQSQYLLEKLKVPCSPTSE